MTLELSGEWNVNLRTGDLLDHWAETAPDRLAVADARTELTYSDLREAVDRCAAAMLRAGVRRGDRVAILAPQRIEVLITFLAASRIGAVWLGLNPKYKLPELSYVVSDAAPKLLIAIARFEGRNFEQDVEALRTISPGTLLVIGLEADAAYDIGFAEWCSPDVDDDLAGHAEEVDAGCAAMLVYTSGSSGRPKGVNLRQRELIFRSRTQNKMFPVAPFPKLLNPLPINHIGGMHYIGFYTFVGGGTQFLNERFEAEIVIEAIEAGRINTINTLPTMFQIIAEHPRFESALLDRLELVVYSGGVLPRPLVEMLMAARCRVGVTYGMSESCGSVTYARKSEASLDIMLNSIGRPVPDGEVRVASADGGLCAYGETGEIQVRRSYCMESYQGRPEATEAAFTEDGWLQTGDQAFLREDGYLEFVGRLSEMFKSGGYNVYPREIELALGDHPEVGNCAVVGVSDAKFGEVGWAWIEPAPGYCPDAEAIKIWVQQRLANYKVPKRIEFVKKLPILPIGKVDKVRLKRQAEVMQSDAS